MYRSNLKTLPFAMLLNTLTMAAQSAAIALRANSYAALAAAAAAAATFFANAAAAFAASLTALPTLPAAFFAHFPTEPHRARCPSPSAVPARSPVFAPLRRRDESKRCDEPARFCPDRSSILAYSSIRLTCASFDAFFSTLSTNAAVAASAFFSASCHAACALSCLFVASRASSADRRDRRVVCVWWRRAAFASFASVASFSELAASRSCHESPCCCSIVEEFVSRYVLLCVFMM